MAAHQLLPADPEREAGGTEAFRTHRLTRERRAAHFSLPTSLAPDMLTKQVASMSNVADLPGDTTMGLRECGLSFRTCIPFLAIALAAGCAEISPQNLKAAGSLGARIMLKDPVDGKCTEAGLKQCNDITEGVLLFVDGKSDEGKEHLRTAALANSPEQTEDFAKAIVAIGEIPGAAEYIGPVLEAARFLVGASGRPTASPGDSAGPGRQTEASGHASSERDDRLVFGMAAPLENSAAERCGTLGLSVACVRVASGPMVFTGVYLVGQCVDRGIALSADPDGDLGAPRWAVTISPIQPVVNGAQLLIPAGQSLFVGLVKSPRATGQQCGLTWSGYKLSENPTPASAPAVSPLTGSRPLQTGPAVANGGNRQRVESHPRGAGTLEVKRPVVTAKPPNDQAATVAAPPGRALAPSAKSEQAGVISVEELLAAAHDAGSKRLDIPSASSTSSEVKPSGRSRNDGNTAGNSEGEKSLTVEQHSSPPESRDGGQPGGITGIAASDGQNRGGEVTGTQWAPFTSAKSGLEFVHLPGGSFHLGCEPQDKDCRDDEKPGRTITIQAFWIGKTDVTVAAYQRCVDDKGCTEPKAGSWANRCNYGKQATHPVNCVDWDQAVAFCTWDRGRLPTAEEWEYAAKGGESRIFPWGDQEPNEQLANNGGSQGGSQATTAVGTYPAGASKQGLLDMAGNVWQWTGSDYEAGAKEIRGGGRDGRARYLRASSRDSAGPSRRSDDIGFRCAM